MGKRIGVVAGLALAAGLAFPAVGQAADMKGKMSSAPGTAKWTLSLTKEYTASPWTQESGWSKRAVAKLGFGLKNALLGWTDLFVEPQEAMQEGGNFFTGLGIGIKDAVENELGGVVHIVTFPITSIDAPLPEGGTQLLNS